MENIGILTSISVSHMHALGTYFHSQGVGKSLVNQWLSTGVKLCGVHNGNLNIETFVAPSHSIGT